MGTFQTKSNVCLVDENNLAGPHCPQKIGGGTRIWLPEDAYVRVLQEGLSDPPSRHRSAKCTFSGRNSGHFGGFSEKQNFANSALWDRFQAKTGCGAGLTDAEHATGHPTLPSRGPFPAATLFWAQKLPFGARRPPKERPFSDARRNTRERKVDFALLPYPSLPRRNLATRPSPF